MSIDASITVDSVIVEHQTGSGPVRALDGVSFTVDSRIECGDHRTQRRRQVDAAGGGRRSRPSHLRHRADRRFPDLSAVERDRSDFRRSHIGFVYQADNLLPFLTLLENVGLQLSLNGAVGNRKIISDARQPRPGWAGLPTARPSLGRPTTARCGGSGDRSPAEIILADEPTGALDAANAVGVIDLLLGMQREIGATLIMVTHDRDAASRLDRQIHLQDGRVS